MAGRTQSRLKERKALPARNPTSPAPSVNPQTTGYPKRDLRRWTLDVGRWTFLRFALCLPFQIWLRPRTALRLYVFAFLSYWILGLMRVLPFHGQDDLAAAAPQVKRCLAEAGVVLLPTETYYGLACNPYSEEAVRRVLDLKDRPRDIPLPVLAADWAQVDRLTVVPEVWRQRLEAVWPGPVTAVLPTRQALSASLAATVAVRIPGHGLLRQLLAVTGPLTGTSANRHGGRPAVDVAGAMRSLVGDPDLALDGGPAPGGNPSTLVDLSGVGVRVLRQGAEEWDETSGSRT